MSTVEELESRQSKIAFWLALVLLPLIAVGVIAVGGPVVPLIGIVTVAAGLFLPPRRTLVVALAAVLLSVPLLSTQDLGYPATRLVNITLAAGLAVLASWTIDQRMRDIRELNLLQASVFASVPDGLAVLNLDGTVVQCNQALAALVPGVRTGARLHPLLDHHLADGRACPGGCPLDIPAMTPNTHTNGETITRDGVPVAIEYTAAAVDDHAVVVSLRDVTAAKQAEQERGMLLEASVRQGEQEHLLRALGAPAYARLPSVSGLQLDVYSSQVDASGGNGGDLVEVVPLADGRVLVMIADAIGAGFLPIRDAWKVLNTARAYMEAGIQLDDIIARTADALTVEPSHPDVSLMLAVIDPREEEVELVGGGHPPALLVRDNGATEWLESTGAGIGPDLPVPTTPLTRQFAPGDSLVFYTDGVVDSSQDVIEGLSNLRSSAAALRKRPTAGWAQTVVQAVTGPDQNSGNATLLLVRLDGSGKRQTTAIL
jgi:PAS domain-containing protein